MNIQITTRLHYRRFPIPHHAHHDRPYLQDELPIGLSDDRVAWGRSLRYLAPSSCPKACALSPLDWSKSWETNLPTVG